MRAVAEGMAAAIFAEPGAEVLEANSEFDREPLKFGSAGELASYIEARLAQANGAAILFVRYPDMGGRAVQQRIDLQPGSVPGHTHRTTWEGWGLISVQLYAPGTPGAQSRITANSERRALEWAPTYPRLEPPGTWHWPAVARHARRLQRALRKL